MRRGACFPGEEGAFGKASPSSGPPLSVKLLLWHGWQVPVFGLRGVILSRDRERGMLYGVPCVWKRPGLPGSMWGRRLSDMLPCGSRAGRRARSTRRATRPWDAGRKGRRGQTHARRIQMEGAAVCWSPVGYWGGGKLMFLVGYKDFSSKDGLSLDVRPVLL